MIQVDPLKRPTIDEVVGRYDNIRHSLSWWRLRARVSERKEDEIKGMSFFLNIRHLFRTLVHLFCFRSFLPIPHY